MMKKLVFSGCLAIMSIGLVVYAQTPNPQRQTSVSLPLNATSERALLDQYCVVCHSQSAKKAGLEPAQHITLDNLDLAHVGEHAESWERVVRKVRAGMMPPAGMRRPDPATFEAMISWLENELDRSAVTTLTPPGLHRLNRTEYANAIRDLLAIEVDPTKYLPPDDSTRGFDNVAGALTLSPALLEGYTSAAGKISS